MSLYWVEEVAVVRLSLVVSPPRLPDRPDRVRLGPRPLKLGHRVSSRGVGRSRDEVCRRFLEHIRRLIASPWDDVAEKLYYRGGGLHLAGRPTRVTALGLGKDL